MLSASLLALLIACPPKQVEPEPAAIVVEPAEEPLVKSGWEGFPEVEVLDELGTVQADADLMAPFVGSTWYLIDLDPANPADLTMTFYEDGSFELHDYGYEGMEWGVHDNTLVFWVNNRYSHHAAVPQGDGSLVGVARQKDGYSWHFRMVKIGPISSEQLGDAAP
jgi:hypothetical protein